jgi:hypothetical protein
LFTAMGPVLAGFDFPIDVPATYGRSTGLADLSTALAVFAQGEWGSCQAGRDGIAAWHDVSQTIPGARRRTAAVKRSIGRRIKS